MGRKLAATVYVTDPDSHESVVLEAGSTPEKRLADLVTNPAAWEDDASENTAAKTPEGDDAAESKPAAKKTAARKPARGRSAADEGDSGD
jgi:hypothetical protein